jgi:hypothetical protein
MEFTYCDNSKINNAIIEYVFENYNLLTILHQLENLLCRHIELRLSTLNKLSSERVTRLVNEIVQFGFKSIDFFLNDADSKHIQLLYELSCQLKCINRIIVVGTSFYKIVDDKVYYIPKNVKTDRTELKHIVNLKYFCEAQKYNPYFNKKICINGDGEIKNYIMQDIGYGNVNTIDIETVSQSIAFRKLWSVNHNQIVQIRESEYRYSFYLPFELIEIESDLYSINFDKSIH